ncbi:T9SS type A sorting domain-containing protein [Flavobacteriaceae bacterium R38]|nr:T9SS type A sorting domain-containing protein [Flavobacteriaceae bacterium R38]
MKKKLLYLLPLALVVLGLISVKLLFNATVDETEKEDTITELRKKHKEYLENSPFKETKYLSKKERKARALPPNAFFEQNWERTLDPSLGHPNYRKALEIQHELIESNKKREIDAPIITGVPGESVGNAWIERGPGNIGGRTRGILFDPNDVNNQRVFAGGVSGGLWVNDNITDPNSVWQLVTGVPENIAVTEIIADPNNSQILYIGSGESYTGGDAIGNGVYRSTDGGVNWEMIFGGPEGTPTVNAAGTQVVVDGIFYVNDIIARNVGGNTELYMAAAGAFTGEQGFNPAAFLGLFEQGLYRSTDNGNTWSLITININNNPVNPNDLELDPNNNIWLATTSSSFGDPGGQIYRSANGTTFTLINTIAGAARTEIEPSSQDANVFYVAANVNGEADLFVTTDAFTTITPLGEPIDIENGIDADDYARGQAFYDLPIEVDPTDDTILYVGGINSFRGNITVDPVDGSRSILPTGWSQISIQGTQFLPQGEVLRFSVMHADIHAMTFRPGNENQAVFGTDGGIYYASNLANAPNSTNAIQVRNNGYAVTQFYNGDIDDASGTMGGGTQDNGTPYNFLSGNNDFFTVRGGDGAYGQFDTNRDGQSGYFIQSTQFISYAIFALPLQANLANPVGAPPSVLGSLTSNAAIITNIDGGNFINEADVDTNLDILYINAVSGGTFRIARYSNLNSISTGSPNFPEAFITDPLLTSNISTLQVSPFTTNSTRLLIGTEANQLLNVENADGENGDPVFTDISGSNFLGSISDIEFGINSQTIMVTFSNYGINSVFYTEDGGATWLPKEGDLPDIPVFSILPNPLNPNEVIIGTQFGVWRTENFLDASPNWQQSFNGMSNVPVRDLDLRPSTNEVLATTHGRGMFTGSFTIDPNDDNDGDGVLNDVDNCPNTPNPDQADADGNGIGDVCQDTDFDGVIDINDNCPNTPNPDQADADGDGMGDVCQDTDGDGVIDIEDNCPDNANPDQADTDGDGIGDVCDNGFLAQDNLTVETVSESCPGLENGIINISVNEINLPYEANLVGNGLNVTQNFTRTTSFEDLPVGSYVVCVSLTDRDFERCFELTIAAAAPLDIDFEGVLPGSVANSSIYSFNVNFGEGPFEIRFNDELIRTTNESSFDVELTGSGTLEIIPSRLCQGIFSLAIDGPGIDGVTAFPNPVVNELTISIPGNLSTVPVSVFNISGQLIYQQNTNVNGNRVNVPFNSMPNGVYFVRLAMDNPVVLKIVK